MKNLFKIFGFILFSVIFGGVFSSFTGYSPYLTTPSVAILTFYSSYFVKDKGLAYASPDLSAISNYAHQFQRSLITTMINGLDIASDIMVIPNIKSSMKLPKLFVGNGFRPYSGSTEFQSGDVVYTDRELKVAAGKREILIDPEDYRHKYLSAMLTPGSGANKKEIPFAQFLWMEVVKNMQREMNDETAYFGFDKTDAVAYSGAATYDPGDIITYTQNNVLHYFENLTTTSAGESPDTDPAKWQNVTARAVTIGLRKIIEDEITGASIVEVTTGAIDATAGVASAAFLALFRSFPVPFRRHGVIIQCSYTDFDFLTDDLVATQQYTRGDVTTLMMNGMLPLPGTERKCWVKPATWLGGSRRLIGNPIDMSNARCMNMYLGTDLLSDTNEITTKENLWTLEGGIKVVFGFQIGDLASIKVGDQA